MEESKAMEIVSIEFEGKVVNIPKDDLEYFLSVGAKLVEEKEKKSKLKN